MQETPDVAEEVREEFVRSIATDWRTATLSAADRALAEYAVKLTRTPSAMRESDVRALQRVGFDDVAIHDAIQVTGYFNYINRIADAVDVELEPEYPPHAEKRV